MITPLLSPFVTNNHTAAERLMNQSGGVVTLPYDLRTPFAKFVVYTGIGRNLLRRYAINRVYRESKFDHPKEFYECAFDIITPDPGKISSKNMTFC